MRITLAGDEYCCRIGNDFYISAHSQTLINRYLSCFDVVNVAFRTRNVSSPDELGKYNIKVTDRRIHMCYIPFFQGPKQYAKVYFKVRKMAMKAIENCDLAILRLPSTTAFAVWDACRKRNIPYATEIVFDCYDARTSSDNLLAKLLWTQLHRKQVKACNEAIGVACVTAKHLQKRYHPSNSNTPTSNYSSIEMPRDFLYKARKFPDKSSYSIVHVANQVQFNSRKGHNELVKALVEIRNHGIDAGIIFVGEDYQNGIMQIKEFARSLGVEQYLHFPGFVTRAKLREILINSDLAVLPTKAEGLPRVIIEAMAMGLPCITTPVSGNPELIDEKYLVDYSDVHSQANRIIELLTNKRSYEDASSANFERSKEYTSDVLNPRRTKFYNQLKNIIISTSK